MSGKLEDVKDKLQDSLESSTLTLSLPSSQLADFYEGEQPVVKSLFKAFVENVSDVTFGNETIAKFIQDGLLSVSDGVLRVSPTIQNDEAFSWWITTLISFTARTMLSIEGLCAKDRTAIYNNLCKLSPYLSRKNSDSSVKQTFCNKCSGRRKHSKDLSSNSVKDLTKTKKKCPGAQCPKRKRMQCEFEAQTRILQNYWRLIRQSIQKIMRCDPSFQTDSKKINKEGRLVALTMGITALCKLDPHQLFKRLECLSTEHVMRIKISLWDILVIPHHEERLKKYYDAKSPPEVLKIAQAKLFIKALLDDFAQFQEVVKDVSSYLSLLDEEYLKQFGVTWKIVNHYIFHKVIYQDELFKSFIPYIESALQVQLIGGDGFEKSMLVSNNEYRDQFPELYSGISELVKSFQLFHRLMLTSREMFRRADLLMQTFSKQQQFLHSKAKVEIIEKDLNFFTQQRRMLRKFVFDLKKNDEQSIDLQSVSIGELIPLELEKNHLDEDADEAEFVRRFKDLLDYGSGKCKYLDDNKGEVICKYCNQKYCRCDECSFYHMILCGLVDCRAYATDSENFHKLFSIDELESDSEVDPECLNFKYSEFSSEEYLNLSVKDNNMLSVICNNSIKTEDKQCETSLNELPTTALFTLHNSNEFLKQAADASSNWDVGTFDCQAICKCEQDDSEDELCNCSKSNSHFLTTKNFTKKIDYSQRSNHRVAARKNFLHRRGKSATTVSARASTIITNSNTNTDRQCFISDDKKSIVHVDKTGICVTKITKSTSHGMFLTKNGSAKDDLCSDDSDDSSEGYDDIKVDIQKISENIVREIEKSLVNDNIDHCNSSLLDNADKQILNSTNKNCFSTFFGSGCRKLIESLMKKTTEGSNANSRSVMIEEDTDESLSVDSCIGRCSHVHDHHDSCQAAGDDSRERFGRCDCCYCTYMANEISSKHEKRRNDEIRQRLRKVLKQREEKSNNNNNRSAHSVSSDTRGEVLPNETLNSEKGEPYIGNKSIDEILKIINSNKLNESNLPPAKAAKKARQKQRKMDEKLKKSEEEKLKKEKEKEEREAREEKLRKQKEEEIAAAKKIEEEIKCKKKELKAKNKRKRNENILTEISVESKANKENTNKIKDKKSIYLETEKKTSSTLPKIQQPNNIEQNKVSKKKNDNLSKNLSISNSAIEINEKKIDSNVETFTKNTIKSNVKNMQNTFIDLKEDDNRKENNENLLNKSILQSENKDNVKNNFEEKKKEQTTSLKANYQTSGLKVLSNITKNITNNNFKTTKPLVQSQKKFNDISNEKKFSNIVKDLHPTNLLSSQEGLSSTLTLQDSVQTSFQTTNSNAKVREMKTKFQSNNETNLPNSTKKTVINGNETNHLNNRAAIIASAAAATGTSLPPLSSLTSEQQQKYFSWIKQLNETTETEQQSNTLNTDISTLKLNQQQHQQSLKKIIQNDLLELSNTAQLNNDIKAIGSERLKINENTALKNLSHLNSQEYKNINKTVSPFESCTSAQPDLKSNIFQSSNTIRSPLSQFSSNALFSIIPNKNSEAALERNVSTKTAHFDNSSAPLLLQQQQQPSQLKNIFPFSATTTSVSRFGAIGEKPPQRKTFNQYAAYDRETNHILGLSNSSLNGAFSGSPLPPNGFTVNALFASSLSGNNNAPSLNSNMLNSASSVNSNLKSSLDSIFTNNLINPSLFQNSLPLHQQRPNSISLSSSHILESKNENISKNPIISQPNQNQQINELSQSMVKSIDKPSAFIWQNDDDAKRFVESEECAVFKFSEY